MRDELLGVHLPSINGQHRHYGHASGILWLTGLSGAGKTSLAMRLQAELSGIGYACCVLDGDVVRGGLNADLGFGANDRTENVRRIGEVAGLFAEAGLVCITACISPFRFDRDRLRAKFGPLFHEIHLAADVDSCEARDIKGLYHRARTGQLPGFTGVDAPYEAPENPNLVLHTGSEAIEYSLARLLSYVTHALPLTPCLFSHDQK